jgi:hypothetical protein
MDNCRVSSARFLRLTSSLVSSALQMRGSVGKGLMVGTFVSELTGMSLLMIQETKDECTQPRVNRNQ